ncbi:MAG: hypothetical protein IIB69_14370 [Proteobacteria bacterium]|nr:hypothetical protein [Pseudomonadota bacterium]
MKHRTDHNQNEIIKAFLALGCDVFDLSSVGNGLCDLVVGLVGINLLVEIKSEKGKLTPAQTEFFKTWKGQKIIITTQAEAIQLVAATRKRAYLENSKPTTRSKS